MRSLYVGCEISCWNHLIPFTCNYFLNWLYVIIPVSYESKFKTSPCWVDQYWQKHFEQFELVDPISSKELLIPRETTKVLKLNPAVGNGYANSLTWRIHPLCLKSLLSLIGLRRHHLDAKTLVSTLGAMKSQPQSCQALQLLHCTPVLSLQQASSPKANVLA